MKRCNLLWDDEDNFAGDRNSEKESAQTNELEKMGKPALLLMSFLYLKKKMCVVLWCDNIFWLISYL